MTRVCWIWLAVALVSFLSMGLSAAEAPSGLWAASAGVVQSGDGDAPITGDLGFEAAAWRVVSEHFDVGVRISSVSFASSGLKFPEEPGLRPGDGTVAIADLAFRWYPLGSEGRLFPFAGVSAGVVFADSFSADKRVIPDLGIVFDTDWTVDSIGYGAEIGLRYDFPGERWFVEGGLRYSLLGAESTGTLEVVPTITRSRSVATGLDSYRLALHIGRYF